MMNMIWYTYNMIWYDDIYDTQTNMKENYLIATIRHGFKIYFL